MAITFTGLKRSYSLAGVKERWGWDLAAERPITKTEDKKKKNESGVESYVYS